MKHFKYRRATVVDWVETYSLMFCFKKIRFKIIKFTSHSFLTLKLLIPLLKSQTIKFLYLNLN